VHWEQGWYHAYHPMASHTPAPEHGHAQAVALRRDHTYLHHAAQPTLLHWEQMAVCLLRHHTPPALNGVAARAGWLGGTRRSQCRHTKAVAWRSWRHAIAPVESTTGARLRQDQHLPGIVEVTHEASALLLQDVRVMAAAASGL
jgi:hypothetical protein